MDLEKYREKGAVPKTLTLEQKIERRRREFDVVREHQASLGNVYVPQRLNTKAVYDRMYLDWMVQGEFDAYLADPWGNTMKYTNQKFSDITMFYFVPKALSPDELKTLLSFLKKILIEEWDNNLL